MKFSDFTIGKSYRYIGISNTYFRHNGIYKVCKQPDNYYSPFNYKYVWIQVEGKTAFLGTENKYINGLGEGYSVDGIRFEKLFEPFESKNEIPWL